MSKRNINKTGRVLLCMLLFAALFAFGSISFAEDDGYYIKNMKVDVTVNADRTFDVVETIDVFFAEERHGIYRDIPTYSSVEREVRLEDVRVSGAPFEYDGYGEIKIGDPDVTVTGDKRYIISYTLWHYADEEPDFDYFYMDVIGDEWDTRIEDFEVNVHLPEGAEVSRVSLTSGGYGSIENDYAAYMLQGNELKITALRGLNAYEGVTAQVEMIEGAFPQAEVWVAPLIIHSVDAVGTLNEYGEMHVEETFDVTVNKEESLYMRLTDSDEQTRNKLKNIKLILPNGATQREEDDYISVWLDDYVGERVSFTLSYDKYYDTSDVVTVEQIVYYSNYENEAERITAEFTAPFAIDEGYARTYLSSGDYGYHSESDYTCEISNNRIRIEFEQLDDSTEDVYICFTVPQEGFLRRETVFDKVLPALSLAMFAAVALFAVAGKRYKINPVPEYYPPEDINPAEIGYIIDEQVSKQDVISLIYYWASKGRLRIEMQGKRKFTLHHLKNLGPEFRSYERNMFSGLWKYGHGGSVTGGELEDRYYDEVDDALKSIRKQFTGVNALADKHRTVAAVCAGCVLPVICAVLALVAVGIRGFGIGEEIAMMIFLLAIDLSLFFTMRKWERDRYKKRGAVKTIFRALWLIIRFALAFLLGVGILANGALTAEGAIVFSLCMNLIPVVAPFIRRRTMMGATLLERALGFKMFLQTAEQERLLMLLDENPDYYYDILPYAQVLGVSNQWMHKFDDILTSPPSWMYGDYGDMDIFRAVNDLSRSMNSRMTSTPAPEGDSGGGGFSGGSGGGGFSGGGSVGGGSGGGGGRSW